MRLAFCAVALLALASLGLSPVALAASLATGLIFWWVAEVNGWQAGACAALLLVSNRLWHTQSAGWAPTFSIGGLYCLFADPWLESWWSMGGFAAAVAGAIVTQGTGGLALVAALGLYWIFTPRKYRGVWWRALIAGVLPITLAAPWFGRLAVGTTSQSLSRMVVADPVLLALAAAALPTFGRELRRRTPASVLLLFALAASAAAALAGAGILPLVPPMAILATAYNPLCSGPPAKWTLAGLIAILAIKAALPEQTWGLSLRLW